MLTYKQKISVSGKHVDPTHQFGIILKQNPEFKTLRNLAALTYVNINYNSILSWWGDQSVWNKEKQKAIEKTREFYRTKNPTFAELYWYVCELRHEIATISSQEFLR